MTLRVGTSGWQYADWRGVYLPAGGAAAALADRLRRAVRHGGVERGLLPAARQGDIRAVARHYPAVVHGSGEGEPLPHPRQEAARPGRADRQADRRGRRARRQARAGTAAGAAPPTLQADPALLDRCLRCFPAGMRVACGFRHPSWWRAEVREVLAERGAALCWADRLGQAGRAAVADRRICLPAVPRGRAPAPAVPGSRRCSPGRRGSARCSPGAVMRTPTSTTTLAGPPCVTRWNSGRSASAPPGAGEQCPPGRWLNSGMMGAWVWLMAGLRW